MSSIPDYHALWKILPSEESDNKIQNNSLFQTSRSDVQNVSSNVPLFFVHVGTNLPLSTSENFLDRTDFGAESEVCCTASTLGSGERRGRRSTLAKEGAGRPKATTIMQGESTKKWTIVTRRRHGQDALEEGEDISHIQDEMPDNDELVLSEISYVIDFLNSKRLLEIDYFWKEIEERHATEGKVHCDDLRFSLLAFIQAIQDQETRALNQRGLGEEEGRNFNTYPSRHDINLLIDFMVGSGFHPLLKLSDFRRLLAGSSSNEEHGY